MILIGHEGHPEVEGTMGQFDETQGGRIMLVEDVPSIFLFNWAEAVLVKPEVTGYTMTVMDHWPGWTTPLTIDKVG